MIQLFIKEDIKEKHRFTVYDHSGQVLYLIEGYWGRKGDIVNLFALNGNILLQAKQSNLSPFFKFDLVHKKEKIGTFRKHPGFFGFRDAFFTVQPKDWLIRGDFKNLNFTIFENEAEIVTIRKFLKQANYLYSLKVKREEDILITSLLSVLLDHYSRKKGTINQFEEISQNNYNLGFLNYKAQSKFYLNKKIAKKEK